MTLVANVKVRRPDFVVQAAIEVGPGEVVALMGPNGAGKSTLVGAIAGFEPLLEGRVVVGERVVMDGTRPPVPAHERGLGVVFQEPRLFPHLSALDNVAFGLRASGTPRREARSLATGWLERVDLAHRVHAHPPELSGGEAQRVALARALATGPQALLLDEPFAAADASARGDLRRLLSGFVSDADRPTLLVTQDLVDAAALADRVVILESGRVTQTGVLREVARHPRSPWAAELVGLNLLRGRGTADAVVLDEGQRIVAVDPPAGECFVAIHPTAVALYPERPEGTPRNVWRLQVAQLEPLGSRVRIVLEGELDLVAEVTPSAVTALGLGGGREVWAAVKATEVTTYPL